MISPLLTRLISVATVSAQLQSAALPEVLDYGALEADD